MSISNCRCNNRCTLFSLHLYEASPPLPLSLVSLPRACNHPLSPTFHDPNAVGSHSCCTNNRVQHTIRSMQERGSEEELDDPARELLMIALRRRGVVSTALSELVDYVRMHSVSKLSRSL